MGVAITEVFFSGAGVATVAGVEVLLLADVSRIEIFDDVARVELLFALAYNLKTKDSSPSVNLSFEIECKSENLPALSTELEPVTKPEEKSLLSTSLPEMTQ